MCVCLSVRYLQCIQIYLFYLPAVLCHFPARWRWRWIVTVMPMMIWCLHPPQAVLMTCLATLISILVWWMMACLFKPFYFVNFATFTLKVRLKLVKTNNQRKCSFTDNCLKLGWEFKIWDILSHFHSLSPDQHHV